MSDAVPATEARVTQEPRPLHADSPLPLYVLFIISGIAGLIYEVMWMRSFMGAVLPAAAADGARYRRPRDDAWRDVLHGRARGHRAAQ